MRRFVLPAALLSLGVACGGGSQSPTTPSTTPSIPVAPQPVPVSRPAPQPVPQSATIVTACTTITRAGDYAIGQDLVQAGGMTPCVVIASSGVNLYCSLHRVPYLAVRGASNVSVKDCDVGDELGTPLFAQTNGFLVIEDSSSVTVTNGDLNAVRLLNTRDALFDRNHLIGPGPGINGAGNPFFCDRCSRLVFSNNTVDHFDTYAVILAVGDHNRITDNWIDGSVPGSSTTEPRDDCILLDVERDDVIANNRLENVKDAGIESVNSVTDTLMENNTITNARQAGIGAYFGTSWHRNTIRGNHIAGSWRGMWFTFIRSTGNVNSHLVTDYGLQDNTIENNTIDATTSALYVSFHESDLGLPLILSNNVLRGNDFGLQAPLSLFPASAFVNGGGNRCAPNPYFQCGP